jgi:hypothetical protein
MSPRRFVIPLGLLLSAAAVGLSCDAPSPVGVDARPPMLLARDGSDQSGGALLSCRPLPYKSVTKTIGPEGGVIEVRHNLLVVPRGALTSKVSITAVAPSDTLALIRLQPEGLRFEKTAFLVETYDHCRVKPGATPRIAVVTDALDVIEYLVSADFRRDDPRFKKDHKWHRKVVGELHHFSNYAVAW